MSGYTLGEIIIWLLLAAAVGFVLGWLLRSLRAGTRAAPKPAEPIVAPGRFAGSAVPLPGGLAPSPAHVIKGNEKSMIYHTSTSPSYERTVAQTWFVSEDDAVAAGFRKPRNA